MLIEWSSSSTYMCIFIIQCTIALSFHFFRHMKWDVSSVNTCVWVHVYVNTYVYMYVCHHIHMPSPSHKMRRDGHEYMYVFHVCVSIMNQILITIILCWF